MEDTDITKVRFANKKLIFFILSIESFFIIIILWQCLAMVKNHGIANHGIAKIVLAAILLFAINIIGFAAVYRKLQKTIKTVDAENQRTKQELQEHKYRAQAFAEATQEGIVISDEGKVIEANQQFLDILGFENLSEIIGKSILEEFTTPESYNIINEHILKNSPEPYEATSYRKDKSILPISIHGHSILYKGKQMRVTAIRDLTEQKRLEQEMRENDLWLRESQRNSHIGSFNFDVKSGTWKSSEELDIILGISNDYDRSLDGWLRLSHPDHTKDLAKHLKEDVMDQNSPFDIEYQIIRPANGKVCWVHGLGNLHFNQEGHPVQMIGTIQDITERKKTALEIYALNENLEKKVLERTIQLQQANKDLESFAYSVSHDLRAPLRHVDGFVKLMYSKITEPDSNITNYFEKIGAATKRMSTMIDDLLSFSRLGRKELVLSTVNLNTIIREIIEHFKPDTEKRNITWDIAKLPEIMGDRNLLKIAFENLVSNAIKYTSKQPEATIAVGASELPGNWVQIYVKDNGIGFDMAYSEKLFGVFQRLHSNEEFEGIGIGLANVRQIIQKHNGTIMAEGKLNEGAAFYVTLPK